MARGQAPDGGPDVPTVGSSTLSLLNAVLRDAPFGFALVDTQLRYLHINAALAALNGRTPEAHRGLTPADISQELDALVGPVLRRVLTTGEAITGLELNATVPTTGAVHHFIFNCYPVPEPDGDALLGLAIAVVDDTERTHSREQLERYARQQGAIVELGMAALRGERLSSLVRRTLVTLREVVGVDRAAVLRADRDEDAFSLYAVEPARPTDVERTRVRLGDSTQAGQTLAANAPIVMHDRATETRFSRWVGAGDLDVRSSVSVVIPTSSGPFGVLGLYHASRWAASPDDVKFVQAVANVIGTAVDRRAAERRLKASSSRLRMAQEAGRLGAWERDLRTGEIVMSDALEHLFGLETGAFDGTMEGFEALVHPDDLDLVRREVAILPDRTDFEFEHRIIRADTGEVRWVVIRGEGIRAEDGTAERLVGVTVDITERKRVEEERAALLVAERAARAGAEEARERLRVLAEATAALSASLDDRETLQTLTHLIVPQYADICIVDLEERGRLRAAAVAHRDPDGEALLWEMRRRYPSATTGGAVTRQALTSAAPVVLAEINDETLRSLAADEGHLALLRQLRATSGISTALVARGRIIGTISLIRMVGRAPFDTDDDPALISELARRAALAIDNARLYSEASRNSDRFRRMAETLQSSLLPPSLPAIPGVDIAATYRAAAVGTTVGGDFYDAFPLADRGWGIVIGDVQGKGTEAASLTAIARHTVRTAAIRHDAAASLQTLNDVLLTSEEHAGRFCTVLYGEVEQFEGGVRLQLASGGHPPALLRTAATGRIQMVGGHGTLMGVLPAPEVRVETVTLYHGDLLVLYTDGVIEARGPAGDFGEEGLARTLQDPPATAADAIARIEQAVTAHSEGHLRDDVAVLVLRAA